MPTLGDRMKIYERVSEGRLLRKIPVILRVDGKAFHSFTRGMAKPVEEGMQRCMLYTAVEACKAIDGARLGYVQSDEISILVTDWASLETQPWFDYRVQKLASVTAALATAAFNEEKNRAVFDIRGEKVPGSKLPRAIFDCRAFNVPHHEVVNYFLWRQQDATRNSVSGLAQTHFSHKRLRGKSGKEMQEMLFSEKGINWNDCPTGQKRGFCVIRIADPLIIERSVWKVDEDIPVFSQDRRYIQDLVDQGEI